MKAKITFLGTGTSHGVPKINCGCEVCASESVFDKRLRCSILVESGGSSILIDTSADFRAQALKYKIKTIDAILFTHAHADHLHGIDDIRAYQTKSSPPIKCFGPPAFCSDVKKRFSYIFLDKMPIGGGTPRISLSAVSQNFEAAGVGFVPIPVVHGQAETYGYRFFNAAYIPDVKEIPRESFKKLEGLDVLIIDALRARPHSTHLCLNESIEIVRTLKPAKTYFTHIDHEIMHERESESLAKLGLNIEIAYDGLEIWL
ncbi:MAG: Phosphoribosyl 1,2-cyclic phosphodiesterase [bacterium ADurb.Bin243]|nr:MAG: Phosphoribosyl 1,2-cyclic phosphodiesterase [bacterium ADurb.Bin243]HOD40463.1 MBL fold metallo-hydrolase [Candidatus Wallbacteria bacterium]